MLFAALLSGRIHEGRLEVIDATGRRHHIQGSQPGPEVTIRLTDPALHTRLFLNPHLSIGEAYMDGTLLIEAGTLHGFLELLSRNIVRLEGHPLLRVQATVNHILRWVHQHNPVERSHRNVAHHYDLSGTLYDLFLDADRNYSCAYFTRPDQSLDQAQDAKKQLIAAKLCLAPGQRVLDIGCGWGGLALHLARHHAVEVVGITLSREQLKGARDRAEAEGLADRVSFHLQDYRHVTERFDRVVSVGMLEHVGATHFVNYFRKVRDLLTEDGLALIHAIGRMDPPGSTNPWLRKYIFPGGYTPALSETLAAVERAPLYVTDAEILRLHYARTLSLWYDRFMANRDQVAALYDERFVRMWAFYLKGCEMAFRYLKQMVFQLQIARHQEAAPLTRDYLLETMPRASTTPLKLVS